MHKTFKQIQVLIILIFNLNTYGHIMHIQSVETKLFKLLLHIFWGLPFPLDVFEIKNCDENIVKIQIFKIT